MAFSQFQFWTMPLWGGNEEKRPVFNGSFSHSSSDYAYHGFGAGQLKGTRVVSPSSSSSSSNLRRNRIKKKWQSREERKSEIERDREHDVVVVPPDGGVCLSGSESEDSDWSIGWLEPHGPDFLSDDETDDSFAVLVPCYKKNARRGIVEGTNTQLLNAIQNLTNEHFNEGKNLMEQWLSSLQRF